MSKTSRNSKSSKHTSEKLIAYKWEGVNKKGTKVKGELNAMNVTLLKAALRKQGITPKKVTKKSTLFSGRKQKLKSVEIAVLTRQLATMTTAGIPLAQVFDIIGKGHENPTMRDLIQQIKLDVESGNSMAESMGKHREYFNDLFCNLIDAGEQAGALDTMLDRIATYREKIESMKARIKKALFYPAAVMTVAILVSVALLMFVVPQFKSVFEDFGAQLPFLTQVVVNMSEFLQSYWYIIFGLLGGALYGIVHLAKTSEKFAYFIDKISLKLPVIGEILRKAAIARFARTLATTFAAGLPLVDALVTVSGSTGNRLYAEATKQIREDVSTGQQIQAAMRSTGLFPNMVVQMVAIGEESGTLEAMLSKVADFYEEEVDNAVDGLSSLLEPIIMVVLGVIIGGLVIAMYLPIFKLGTVI